MNFAKKIDKLLKRISIQFKKEKIPFALAGGLAAAIWGKERATVDIDIVIPISGDHQIRIPAIFNKMDHYVQSHPEPMEFKHVSIWRHVFIDPPETLTIDLMTTQPEFVQKIMDRRIFLDMDGYELPIVSKEDLVVLKSLSGRKIDHYDIQNILEENPDIDLEYVKKELSSFGVECEFEVDDENSDVANGSDN